MAVLLVTISLIWIAVCYEFCCRFSYVLVIFGVICLRGCFVGVGFLRLRWFGVLLCMLVVAVGCWFASGSTVLVTLSVLCRFAWF